MMLIVPVTNKFATAPKAWVRTSLLSCHTAHFANTLNAPVSPNTVSTPAPNKLFSKKRILNYLLSKVRFDTTVTMGSSSRSNKCDPNKLTILKV